MYIIKLKYHIIKRFDLTYKTIVNLLVSYVYNNELVYKMFVRNT